MVRRELLSTWAVVLATMAACKGGSDPEPAAAAPSSAAAEPATPVTADEATAEAAAALRRMIPEAKP